MATPGRLLCTLSGVPTNSRGGFTPLTALHVGPKGPPDVPGGPEKPVVVVVGDAVGNVLVWSVPDGRPLSKAAVTEEEALSCFQQVGDAPTCPCTLACLPVRVWSGQAWCWLGLAFTCRLTFHCLMTRHTLKAYSGCQRGLVPLPLARRSAVASVATISAVAYSTHHHACGRAGGLMVFWHTSSQNPATPPPSHSTCLRLEHHAKFYKRFAQS